VRRAWPSGAGTAATGNFWVDNYDQSESRPARCAGDDGDGGDDEATTTATKPTDAV